MNNMSVKSKRMTKMRMFCLNDGDNDVIQQNHDEPAYHEEQAFHHSPSCKENANAINELKQEFVKLNEQLKGFYSFI